MEAVPVASPKGTTSPYLLVFLFTLAAGGKWTLRLKTDTWKSDSVLSQGGWEQTALHRSYSPCESGFPLWRIWGLDVWVNNKAVKEDICNIMKIKGTPQCNRGVSRPQCHHLCAHWILTHFQMTLWFGQVRNWILPEGSGQLGKDSYITPGI